MIDFESFTHLTFDCYGTLIDWENGILTAIAPVLERHKISAGPEQVLRLFAKYEAEEEARSWQSYRGVLRSVMSAIAAELNFSPRCLRSRGTAGFRGKLAQRFRTRSLRCAGSKGATRLVIISNIDDALFAKTAELLEVEFDGAITAEQVRHYKPSPENFRFALKRLGVSPRQVLHVAQSLFHDHVPAKQLGFTTVWVNRPSRLPAPDLSLPAEVRPDLEVRDLQSLVAVMERGG
jgi:2-haloacid dehalogenase